MTRNNALPGAAWLVVVALVGCLVPVPMAVHAQQASTAAPAPAASRDLPAPLSASDIARWLPATDMGAGNPAHPRMHAIDGAQALPFANAPLARNPLAPHAEPIGARS